MNLVVPDPLHRRKCLLLSISPLFSGCRLEMSVKVPLVVLHRDKD
jgi:hypothetical protein